MTITPSTNIRQLKTPAKQRFKDLDLKFTRHPVTNDVSRKYDEESIKQAVKFVLLINHYDKPFHPEIGSGIPSLLFENADPLTAFHIENEIRQTLSNFEPRIEVTGVSVVGSPDEHSYDITLQYRLTNTEEPKQITVVLERLR